MNNEGIENKAIAKFLSIRTDTVTRWVKLYLEEGIKGIGQLEFTGKRKSVLEDVKGQIEQSIAANCP